MSAWTLERRQRGAEGSEVALLRFAASDNQVAKVTLRREVPQDKRSRRRGQEGPLRLHAHGRRLPRSRHPAGVRKATAPVRRRPPARRGVAARPRGRGRPGPDRARLLRAARQFLRGIGETELKRDMLATPRRVAEAWSAEIVSGYRADPRCILAKTFPAQDHDMVVVRDIPFTSVCVHHLLPFHGTAHVAYLPDDCLVGLSKITRAVDALARRLQLQERLTRQVVETLGHALRPLGAACRMDAEHLCMTIRGTRKRGTRVVTTAFSGAFRSSSALRAEFLRLTGARRSGEARGGGPPAC
jgi:GTP cyclohydrolase I